MKVRDKTTFQSGGLYNLTAQIQENTILNRGLLDLGGCAVPHMIMANNKDEAIERGTMSGLYFITAFMAPFVLLPFFNKRFLSMNKIVNNFSNNEKKIIEVSKKYLTKDADYMVDGIRKTAVKLELEAEKKGKKVSVKNDFENILKRFDNKEELKKKLLKSHEQILFSDFLTTAWMWCATPWVAAEATKYRTKRSGFSATYGMIDQKQSDANAEKHNKDKKKKLLYSALIGIIPAVLFPKIVTNGLTKNNKLLNFIKKAPENFNYTKGMFPSKTIFGAIWLLCDYPSSIVSARDKYERRDRAVRNAGTFAIFMGGDFVLNNVLGRLSDKFLSTKIMDRTKIADNASFFKKLTIKPKDFADIPELKNVAPDILKRTKTVGAGLYWATLIANMLLLGFTMPAILNKVLKNTLEKDKMNENSLKPNFEVPNKSNAFDKLMVVN